MIDHGSSSVTISQSIGTLGICFVEDNYGSVSGIVCVCCFGWFVGCKSVVVGGMLDAPIPGVLPLLRLHFSLPPACCLHSSSSMHLAFYSAVILLFADAFFVVLF